MLRLVIAMSLAVVGGACSGTPTSPTPSANPPASQAATVSIRGTVAEYPSPQLNERSPIADVTVSVAGQQRTATTDATGQYSLEVTASSTYRVKTEREGYQTQEREVTAAGSTMTVDFVMVRNCSPWPDELGPMMARLGLSDFGVCLVEWLSSQPSNYVAAQRTVYYRSPSPVGCKLAALAHELCHTWQHKVILESGKEDPKHDGEFVPWWTTETPEGKHFVEITGWRHLNPGGPAPGFGWVESPEPWSAGYPNPIEDHAEACAFWHNPGNDSRRGKSPLTTFAPRRAEWMRRWMPY